MKYAISPVKASLFNLDFIGDVAYEVRFIAPLNDCDETTITFYKGDEIDRASIIKAGILILNEKMRNRMVNFEAKAILFSKNPMLLFAQIIKKNFNNDFTDSKTHKIQKVIISNDAYIEEEVTIGENTKIFPNTTIFNSTSIGKNCIIQSGSILGGIGMSYIKDENLEYYRLVHLGNLEILDNVDIGTNTSILRGILETTKIGSGTKIGNNVNIGHNVIIGQGCYISSGVTIGGACIIGDNCWISPGVVISDHINIGSNSNIGVGSVVIKEVLSDSFYLGNPARKIK